VPLGVLSKLFTSLTIFFLWSWGWRPASPLQNSSPRPVDDPFGQLICTHFCFD
jgi:hypothetical protein